LGKEFGNKYHNTPYSRGYTGASTGMEAMAYPALLFDPKVSHMAENY